MHPYWKSHLTPSRQTSLPVSLTFLVGPCNGEIGRSRREIEYAYRQQALWHIHQPQYSSVGCMTWRQDGPPTDPLQHPSLNILNTNLSLILQTSIFFLAWQVRISRRQVLYGVIVCYGSCSVDMAHCSIGSIHHSK